MIRGIGSDIIEVSRIEASIEKHGQRFLDRLFTIHEQDYCKKYRDSGRHFAARFAAKEAVVKAFGTGFRDGISWLDIEVVNDENGKPEVRLPDYLVERFHEPVILLTLSHCKEYATATAIMM